jgi:hypothetical protein
MAKRKLDVCKVRFLAEVTRKEKMETELKPGYYWWKYKTHPWWSGIIQVYGVPPFCKWAIICGGDNCSDPSIVRIGELDFPTLGCSSSEIEIGPRIETPPEQKRS